jgi:hypothetical protein
LLNQDRRTRHDDSLKLAMWLDPDARTWVAETSRVLNLIAARPA